jgi:peptidoglycan-N-acetylglucosamine deacetylase
MRKAIIFAPGLIVAAVTLGCNLARAEDCPGNPDALGTSRVLALDPREYPRVGAMGQAMAVPLSDKEVVVTFDDGPVPRYSNQILDILAAQCVKATFFLVGEMARAHPQQCAGFSPKVIPSAPIAKIIPCALASCHPH